MFYYTITARRAHKIQSRGASHPKQAAVIVKAMQQEGFDVVSIIDHTNRPLTIEELTKRAGDDEAAKSDFGELAAQYQTDRLR